MTAKSKSNTTSQITIDYRFFNPLYWHLKDAFESDYRMIFVYGGYSAAKTYSIAQAIYTEVSEKQIDAAVVKKESTTITEYVYKDFKAVHNSFEFGTYEFQQHLIKYGNTSRIKFMGVDDPEKLKGISGITLLYLNELTKMDYEDFYQAKKRLRGLPNQKIIADWNPESEDSFIKVKVLDKYEFEDLPLTVNGNKYTELKGTKQGSKCGKVLTIKTTFKDNYWVVGSPCGEYGFIDQQTLDDFEFDRIHEPDRYKVGALGDWGVIKSGMEFYHQFSKAKHVKPCPYDQKRAIHFSFDQNISPYLTCLVEQVQDNGDLWQVAEHCLEAPLNSAEAAGEWLSEHYRNHESIVFVHGDSTSKKRNSIYKDQKSFYDILFKELAPLDPIDSIKTNPLVRERRRFMNLAFAGRFDWKIYIDPSCKNTIKDLEQLQLSNTGDKVEKSKKMVNVKGAKYQELGHCGDAKDYVVVDLKEDYFKEYSK